MQPYNQNPKQGTPAQGQQQQKKEFCGIAEFKDTLTRHTEAPSKTITKTEVKTTPKFSEDVISEALGEFLSQLLDFSTFSIKFIITLPINVLKFSYRLLFVKLPASLLSKRKKKKQYLKIKN